MISLFGFDAGRPPPGSYRLVDGVPHFLSNNAAGLIAELARSFEPVWCSGWEEKADEVLPAVLGLPKGLAHVSFPPIDGAPSRHWKLASIDGFASPQRPLAWIDDAFDDSCHTWAAQRPGPTRLLQTDPAVGLTRAQTADLLGWAQALSA